MGSIAYVEASLTAQNTFSDAIELYGDFNFSLSGTWVATVFEQRSYDYDETNPSGATWLDVAQYTGNVENVGFEPERGIKHRFGVKTGGFTSGTIVGRLSQ